MWQGGLRLRPPLLPAAAAACTWGGAKNDPWTVADQEENLSGGISSINLIYFELFSFKYGRITLKFQNLSGGHCPHSAVLGSAPVRGGVGRRFDEGRGWCLNAMISIGYPWGETCVCAHPMSYWISALWNPWMWSTLHIQARRAEYPWIPRSKDISIDVRSRYIQTFPLRSIFNRHEPFGGRSSALIRVLTTHICHLNSRIWVYGIDISVALWLCPSSSRALGLGEIIDKTLIFSGHQIKTNSWYLLVSTWT
jgi:hypothetical protein